MQLFAVHIADGFLSQEWLLAGWLISAILLLEGLRQIRDEEIPRVGLLTAALFVASQLHIPVGIGSVHLLLNAIAGILLGRLVGIAMLVALVFQSLLFAHGGLTTLGLNAAIMGLPATIGGLFFALYRGRLRNRTDRSFTFGLMVGVVVSSLTVAANALVIWFGMPEGGSGVALTILLLHLPVVAVEGIGTGLLVAYLMRVKPDWLKIQPTHSGTGVTSANGTSH